MGNVFKIDRPNEKQLQAMKSTKRIVIFGGARGGGKTWMVRVKAVLMCLAYSGMRVLIMRRSYNELTENHINPLKKMLYGIARYNTTEKKFTFENGSIIRFMFCARDDDLQKIQGHEYDIIFIDEATQMTEYQIKQIYACVRGTNDFPKRLYLTCNPGGRGHGYIKRLKEGRFLENENGEEYEFIQSLVTDNKVLMQKQPEYIEQLKALPPKQREAWLYGSWDIYEGQFFEEFIDDPAHYEDWQYTHVIPPLRAEDMKGWKIYRSFDWGYNHPFSVGWWAVDYEGVIYRILELYGCKTDKGEDIPNTGVKWIDEKIFKEIARLEREHPYLKGKHIYGVADPSIWAGSGDGISRADTAAKCGVYFEKGNNDRIPGWMQCHYRLAFDENGKPMMYVFSTCKAFIRTIPMLCYDEHIAEDLDTDGEDHVADEWRYLCMARPIKPRETRGEYIPLIDPLNQYKNKYRR